MLSMGDEDLCRLCAELKPADNLVCVEDEEGIKEQLASKILKFFEIKILPDDRLPICVCSKCCERVKITSDFNDRVHEAQIALKNMLETEFNADGMIIKQSQPPRSSSPEDFVECLLSSDNDARNLATQCTAENDCLEKELDIESDYNDSVEELSKPAFETHTKKRKPTRSKTKKTKKKENQTDAQPKQQSDAGDNDSLSELSGVSDAERNEDGSLILRQALEGWDSYPWVCADCNVKPSSMADLRNHHQVVHGQNPKYVCVDCPKIYTKYYTFISHVRGHRYHLRFCCDVCDKFFPNKKLLEAHHSTHVDARPYACQTCGKSFRMQSALYVHARSHLPSDVKNKYQCDQCPKRFGTKPNLMAHKRIHSGVRDYTCDQCGKSFIQKGNLDNHLLTHTAARPFSCQLCGKAFKTLMRLKKHGSVHSGLKPHKCDVCGRQFRERGTLKEHHRIHTGAMPFTCEFCGKCFRFKGVLTTHRRQHTGERPYSCHDCQHHFTNWPNYNKHMKRRHGINTSVTVRKPQSIPPTGMPNRNPPGTVLVPPQQPVVEQTTFVEADPMYSAPQPNARNAPPSMVHTMPQYYVPSVLSLYNLQDATELMHHS